MTDGQGGSTIRGEPGKCLHLYHYYQHPTFGWMYVRLQTWFPFEIQVGLNGREWLARQMDRDKLRYTRHENKFLWVRDWQRAQQLLDEQLQTDWPRELDALQQQVHPLHPEHLGRMPVKYNWTVYQSEWATDVPSAARRTWSPGSSVGCVRRCSAMTTTRSWAFSGMRRRCIRKGRHRIETNVDAYLRRQADQALVDGNSLKLYHEANVLRAETTI